MKLSHYAALDFRGNSMFILLNASKGMRELTSSISMPNTRPALSISISMPSWSLRVLPTFPSWNWIYRASAWSSKLISIFLRLLQPIRSKNNYSFIFLPIYHLKSIAGKFFLGNLASLKTVKNSVRPKHSLFNLRFYQVSLLYANPCMPGIDKVLFHLKEMYRICPCQSIQHASWDV